MVADLIMANVAGKPFWPGSSAQPCGIGQLECLDIADITGDVLLARQGEAGRRSSEASSRRRLSSLLKAGTTTPITGLRP
jgi:hypothetical protein